MAGNFEILLDKLDNFIRRYYLNLLIKGALLFGAGFLILFISFSGLEYFGYFSTPVRFVLFYGFLAFNAFVLLKYFLKPLAGFLKIGKRIDEKDAAQILGRHFKNELNDKITNALQLKKYMEESPGDRELVMAGIDQKSRFALNIPFSQAIDLNGNRKYLPFFLFPLLVLCGFILFSPGFIIEPANRIARYETYFTKPAPFNFVFENELMGFQGENIKISVRSQGSVLPSLATIRHGGGEFVMNDDGKGLFSYLVRNLQESFEFFIESEGFVFGPFHLKVVQKPSFNYFTVKVENPAYTNLGVLQFSNIGDLVVAEGALISWEFNTRGSGYIYFFKGEDELESTEVRASVYTVSLKANESFYYKVYSWNSEIGKGDSLSYFVQVKPDAWPQIQIEEQQDSVLLSHLFYRGIIQDDYGFSNLEFRYRILDERQKRTGKDIDFFAEKLPFDTRALNQTFYHHFDLNSIYVNPGETVEYFFTVSDNDGINGAKTTRSRTFSFYVPSQEELLARSRVNNEVFKSELSSGISDVRESRREIEEIKRQMLDSERLNWQQRDAIENLLDKQKEIEEKFERLREEKGRNELRQEQFSEMNERIREKQDELSRLYEEVVSDELRELMEKIREEIDKLDKNQVYDMLNQMEFEMRNLENQMDRALEFFKQLEIERLLQQSVDLLEKAKEKQDHNIESTRSGQSDKFQIIDNQEDINKNIKNVTDLLQEFREKNQELRRPHRIDDTSDAEKSLGDVLQQALDQLEQGQQRRSLQQQQSGRQQMDQLSQRLQNMQAAMFQDQLVEDARALRIILENLLKSSFAQEGLLLEVRSINVNDPRYVELIQEQRKIQEDLRMIEDSLVALSKRQLQIGSYVNREIGEININLARGMEELINRRRFQGASRQQFVMTHINNLALLLNESLQNMQMQMANNSGNPQPGNGQCQGGFPDLRQMQEQLNQMLEKLQSGHQPMPGESGQSMSMSEQLARMAAEQEAIRNMLRGLADDLKQSGEDTRELDQLQRDMERTELDIVRRNVTRLTIQRQERILTRLLEHEKALLEREQEERREGTTAENYKISNPADVFEYNKIRNRELEMLRSLPPGLKPFYRSLVENYFLNVE